MTTKRKYFFLSHCRFGWDWNNAVRELVKERIPWRCLERLKNSTSVYLLVKCLGTILCVVQVLVFDPPIWNSSWCSGWKLFKFSVVTPPTAEPTSIRLWWIWLVFFLSNDGSMDRACSIAISKRKNPQLHSNYFDSSLFFQSAIIRTTTMMIFPNREKKLCKNCGCLGKCNAVHAAEILMDLQ